MALFKPSTGTWQHIYIHITMAYQLQYQYEAAMQGKQEHNLRKGPWLQEEDEQLTSFVTRLGERRWDSLAKVAGLRRSGKSCRLRWLNYLRPNLKHGPFSVEEEQLILRLQQLWGNKWSRIARSLPGRTDNEIKNYWRTHLRKRAQVQQEGLFQDKLENSAQDVFYQESNIDMVSHHVNLDCQESDSGSKDSSFDALPLSDWELRRSPYETRISDWIAELQNDYRETEQEQDCDSTGSYDYCPSAFIDDCDAWDYSGSLWDMN